jgi:hypothetical protein
VSFEDIGGLVEYLSLGYTTDNISALSDELLTKFELIANYNAAAYCRPQQHDNVGGKVNCGSKSVCSIAQAADTKIIAEFEK